MFNSYFFIPADKIKYIKKIDSIEATHFIFDLEESVYYGNVDICIENLSKINVLSNFAVRLPLNYNNLSVSENLLMEVYGIGFRTFVLPKMESDVDFYNLVNFALSKGLTNIRYIIIVETPKLLLYIEKILEKSRECIDCVIVGSHDFCSLVGCKHTIHNLLYLRLKLISVCKAFNVEIIDFVSTEIQKMDVFANECIEAFDMGFDGKAIIHPNQLKALSSACYYSEADIKEAIEVQEQLDKCDMNKFSIIKVAGKIYEKPHLKRIYNIINYIKRR